MVLGRKHLIFFSLIGLSGAALTLVGCEKPQEANATAEATWGGPAMPAFKDKLSQQDVDDVLAWVQSNWSDEIYKKWYERNEKKY